MFKWLSKSLKPSVFLLRSYEIIMENQEPHFEARKRESILDRQKIIAPQNFVSVFHETKEEFLSAIDRDGLKKNIEIQNIGKAKAMIRRNKIVDDFKPEELKVRGISRNNIYAYPFLEYGHGLIGADQRFVKRDERILRNTFENALENGSAYSKFLEYWEKLGVNTTDEYIRKMTDPEYLKLQYPGEVIEMKVDPQKCYVGNLEYITRIMDDIHRGRSEGEATQRQAEEYWKNLITLEDFLRWYRKPEWAEDGNSIKDADEYKDGEPLGTSEFYPIKGAPDNFPWIIHQPEILIPEDISQDHIRLVK